MKSILRGLMCFTTLLWALYTARSVMSMHQGYIHPSSPNKDYHSLLAEDRKFKIRCTHARINIRSTNPKNYPVLYWADINRNALCCGQLLVRHIYPRWTATPYILCSGMGAVNFISKAPSDFSR